MKYKLNIINKEGNVISICYFESFKYYTESGDSFFYDIDENVICKLSGNTDYFIKINL